MKILDSNNKNFYSELDKIIDKRKNINKSFFKKVEKIINDVRKHKDLALIKYERKFNNNSKIIPSKKEITEAIKLLDPSIKKAIDDTYNRVKDWHLKQKTKDIYYDPNTRGAISSGATKFDPKTVELLSTQAEIFDPNTLKK